MGLPEKVGYSDNVMFHWVDDKPTPKGSHAMREQQVKDLYYAAGTLRYRGEWCHERQMYILEDPAYAGMTMFEVLVLKSFQKALNDDKERERVMDRVLGKPKQAVEQNITSMTYTELLESLHQEEQKQQSIIVDDWGEVDDEPSIEDLINGI